MIDPHDVDTPLFTVRQTAHAIGRSFQLIRKWQDAGIPLISADDAPGSAGRGRRTLYTLRTTVTLALMAEMTAWGVPADTAYLSAGEFTHSGDGPSGWADEPTSEIDARNPCELFKHGATWLVIHDQRDIAKLVNVHSESPFELPDEFQSSALIIDCGMVMRRVVARLDAMAVEVLEKVNA